MPNKLSQFWQELKRRKVTRVITVYAASAFVILELVSMSEEPFGLPGWTFVLSVILLSIGFLIAIILSWIYDIHPEGGIMKTEPVQKVKPEDTPGSSNSWKIASYISFMVIVGLIVLNLFPRTAKKEILDKSIAVLPFDNDSPVSGNAAYINGYCTAIHSNLCKIKDLRVFSLQSTERYRNQAESIPEVAKNLGVAYILSARGQIINNRVRLTVYLTDARDEIIWSRPYDRQIEVVDDHIDIQSEIAQLVADELQATITPEEKGLMSKIPTSSLSAYDLYQRGMDYYLDYEIRNDLEALERAESYFHEALGIDSTYANAYVGLADIYWEKQYLSDNYLLENLLDSVPVLLNLALSYDELSSEAYTLRGFYYSLIIGNRDRALNDFEKAIELNPNFGRAYFGMGIMYSYSNFVKSLESYCRAISIDRGQRLANYFWNLGGEYFWTGFLDKAGHYYSEALKLSGDSASYYFMMAQNAFFSGEDNKAIDYSRKALLLDSTSDKGYLAQALLRSGKHKEALAVYESWIDDMNEIGGFDPRYAYRIAYAYWRNGLAEEAEYYFDKQIEYSSSLINLNRPWAQDYFAYYDLAGVYAFRGEKEKAYENLKAFNQIQEVPFWTNALIKREPFFDSIRDESEFQQIVREVEAKYQASHERVRQWLEENDML